MKIIIGLGNPGKKYENTRHNAGFMTVNALAAKEKFAAWRADKKSKSLFAAGTIGAEKIYLVKPQTFMNLSGDAVSAFISYRRASPKDILIIHDELDLPLGDARLIINRGSAGHKGVASIIEKLGTKNFARLRLGIRPEGALKIDAEKFVLGTFTKEEKQILKIAVSEAAQKILKFIDEKTDSKAGFLFLNI